MRIIIHGKKLVFGVLALLVFAIIICFTIFNVQNANDSSDFHRLEKGSSEWFPYVAGDDDSVYFRNMQCELYVWKQDRVELLREDFTGCHLAVKGEKLFYHDEWRDETGQYHIGLLCYDLDSQDEQVVLDYLDYPGLYVNQGTSGLYGWWEDADHYYVCGIREGEAACSIWIYNKQGREIQKIDLPRGICVPESQIFGETYCYEEKIVYGVYSEEAIYTAVYDFMEQKYDENISFEGSPCGILGKDILMRDIRDDGCSYYTVDIKTGTESFLYQTEPDFYFGMNDGDVSLHWLEDGRQDRSLFIRNEDGMQKIADFHGNGFLIEVGAANGYQLFCTSVEMTPQKDYRDLSNTDEVSGDACLYAVDSNGNIFLLNRCTFQ